MRVLVFACALVLQLTWIYGYPSGVEGVGSYAYQDSTGHRYGGTYSIKDGKLQQTSNDGDPPTSGSSGAIPDFVPLGLDSFNDPEEFFPAYFKNFENILQEVLQRNIDGQRLALDAARKAYDLTSNQAGYYEYIPNFASSFGGYRGYQGFPGYGNFGPDMSGFGQNAAFAGGAAGPGYTQHMDLISPSNPNSPNVQVTRFSQAPAPGSPQHYSVSSHSSSSSNNVNGVPTNQRTSSTTVNNNGDITSYRVTS